MADAAVGTAPHQETDVAVLVAQRGVKRGQADGRKTPRAGQFQGRASLQFWVIGGQRQRVGSDLHARLLGVPAGVGVLGQRREDVHHMAQAARAAGLAVAERAVLVVRRRGVKAIVRRVAEERLLREVHAGRLPQGRYEVQRELHVGAPVAGPLLPAAVVAAPGRVRRIVQQRRVLEPLPSFGPLVDERQRALAQEPRQPARMAVVGIALEWQPLQVFQELAGANPHISFDLLPLGRREQVARPVVGPRPAHHHPHRRLVVCKKAGRALGIPREEMLQAAFGFLAQSLVAGDQISQRTTLHHVHRRTGGAHHIHGPRPVVRALGPIARLGNQLLVDLPLARRHQRVDRRFQLAAGPAADLLQSLARKEQSRSLLRDTLDGFVPIRKRKRAGVVRHRERPSAAEPGSLVRFDAVTPEPLPRWQRLLRNKDRSPQIVERASVRRVKRRGC